ncbi:DNA binding domain-containing protein, excisionase family [Sulfitobacter marinus]|uniref:DNA binding domain-containing protein, excisionase family n=1 Tax=Sulfitobacter marinus TaxID=394264 RepID=A0A1I6UKQ9_9RHOB|nr:helix-turn-helix domain-containing protein [Sulfitobacter marinus]SFT01988.1 DNA binding domain-containing protein, excisionase family [Sulfitobacter marinus]
MLTVEQVSKHFNLSCATIRRKAAEKDINAIRIGREYRFEWVDLWSCESAKMPRASNSTRYKENLLTKSEIATNFQVSVRTVERWIVNGMPTRNVFSNVRCNPHDVTEWHLGRGVAVRDSWWQQ